MSDNSYYTATAESGIVSSMLSNLEAGLALARFSTVLLTAGSVTLSANYDLILADSTTSTTLSLPPSPSTGDEYRIVKYDATAGTLTVSRNGKNINSAASNKTTTTQWAGWWLTYSGDATVGWFAVDLAGT